MLKEICTYFNVNMASIANYTNASLHTLKSLATQRRQYNITLLNKVLVLYKALLIKTPVKELSYANQYLNNEKQNAIIYLQQEIQKTQKQLHFYTNTLKKMKTKREVFLRGLNACNILLQNPTTVNNNTTHWAQLRKKHLQQKLTETSLHKQIILTAKVKSLQTKLTAIQNAINR